VKVEGTYSFDATPDRVWAILLAPTALAACIPGCREFKGLGDDRYEVVMRAGMGAIGGTYRGKVALTDIDEGRSFRMIVEGKGSGGSIRGDSLLSLQERDGATQISVDGDARVTGIIARVGQRLIGSASKLMMDQFFQCMRLKLDDR
jgi:hypothetical protein